MKKDGNNYAFIDSQNLNLVIQKLGWKLDYRRFCVYLAEKYSVRKAYMFIGFSPLNQALYDSLQEAGFVLVFKPTIPAGDGKIKGHVGADLVLRAVLELTGVRPSRCRLKRRGFHSLVQYPTIMENSIWY